MSQTFIITPAQFTTFGDLLKFLRRRAGLSQQELSIAVGYSRSQISRLETNERAPDVAAVAARFVPELDLAKEPVWVARLLELAAESHAAAETFKQADAAQTPPGLKHNLPNPFTSFIGREKELAELGQILRVGASKRTAPRLVTCVGPGGVGKTRLARQGSFELLDSFVDGVWWIDLAPLVDATLIPQTVAHVLAVREQMGRPLLETLTDSLRRKKMLLILDNCEHLIAASAQLAETLLSGCPDLKILATSREVLNMEGERVFHVPPLSTPDARAAATVETLIGYEAVQLFVERAETVLPEFALSGENAASVNRICRQLDGIPLAIELSAAQLRVLSLTQLADRLADRFHLLTNGRRTALPRHQTLSAMIDSSYDLLHSSERILLQRFSVFLGGWTLEAAEAVCAGGEIKSTDVLRLLTQLVSKSLVIAEHKADQTIRYGMLETIRQYALAKLAAGCEEDDVRRRHAEYYGLLTETRVKHLDRVDLDNLRGALTWSQFVSGGAELHLRLATGTASFIWNREMRSEARGWLESALALANAEGLADSIPTANVLFWLGTLFANLGEYETAQVRMSQSIKLFQKWGDRAKTAEALMQLGWIEREHDDMPSARRYMEQALAIYRELGDRGGIAGALVTLGQVLVSQEKLVEAQTLLTESLALFQEFGAAEGIGWSLNHLGQVARLSGEYAHARQLFEASLTLFRQIDPHYMGIGETPRELGETALAEGDGETAMSYFREALSFYKDYGMPSPIAWCLAGIAGATVLQEELERAAFLWGTAEHLRQSIGARTAPATRATHERLMTLAREQLGEQAFAAAWAKGEATLLEEVLTTISQPT